MKLIHPFLPPFPCWNLAVDERPRRRILLYADEPPPLVPSASKVHPQVRPTLVILPGRSPLTAGDEPRRNRPVKPPPSL